MNLGLGHIVAVRRPVARGIARSGPAILSYGFRPFFLLAAAFAVVSMIAWIGALSFGWEVGGSYGALNWHAHEMLFGYAAAALAGFMLTAIPNWTGRLPVSGLPLLGLVLIWLIGRVALAFPGLVGLPASMVVDSLFLPLLAFVAAVEIVAGRNWKNLKILGGLVGLSLANVAMHLDVAFTGATVDVVRLAVSIYIMLIMVVGGRIIPSFTRNWLVKAHSPALPRPFDRFDALCLGMALVALLAWTLAPESLATVILSTVTGAAHAVRLWRWVGWRTVEEPLLLALHVGYGFVPLGFFATAMAAAGWIAAPSSLHVFAVGAVGTMTLAVMTRASLGHTGRPTVASLRTAAALLAVVVAATARPFAELIPDGYHALLAVAGVAWITAFGLFLSEHGPKLMRHAAP
jgi:uncharacterized protein involved in response to NO